MPSVAKVPSVCATCRKNHFLEVRQEIIDGQLKWLESFACECGHGFESSGAGLPTPGLRNAILQQSGRGQVWIDEAAAVPKALALLVKGLGMNEDEAKKRMSRLPAVAFEGTHAEATFISMALEKGGVIGRVVSHLPKQP